MTRNGNDRLKSMKKYIFFVKYKNNDSNIRKIKIVKISLEVTFGNIIFLFAIFEITKKVSKISKLKTTLKMTVSIN